MRLAMDTPKQAASAAIKAVAIADRLMTFEINVGA